MAVARSGPSTPKTIAGFIPFAAFEISVIPSFLSSGVSLKGLTEELRPSHSGHSASVQEFDLTGKIIVVNQVASGIRRSHDRKYSPELLVIRSDSLPKADHRGCSQGPENLGITSLAPT